MRRKQSYEYLHTTTFSNLAIWARLAIYVVHNCVKQNV